MCKQHTMHLKRCTHSVKENIVRITLRNKNHTQHIIIIHWFIDPNQQQNIGSAPDKHRTASERHKPTRIIKKKITKQPNKLVKLKINFQWFLLKFIGLCLHSRILGRHGTSKQPVRQTVTFYGTFATHLQHITI